MEAEDAEGEVLAEGDDRGGGVVGGDARGGDAEGK